MKKSIIFLMISVLLVSTIIIAAPLFKVKTATKIQTGQDFVPGQILVKFREGFDDTKAIQGLGCATIGEISKGNYKHIAIPANKTIEDMVAEYSANPNVLYAEPNYIYRLNMVPNDPYYVYQWHMPMINMGQAWDQNTGTGAVVAILDVGVAYENYGVYAKAPDLAQTNFVPGYDFINNDSHPNDDNGHGTHVCGTIAQSTNNNLGVAGIAYNCSIMPVKVLDAAGSGSTTAIANGIYFAADNGAKVINMSLGSSSYSSVMNDACNYAKSMGVTIICAAGNSGRNVLEYPAANAACVSVSAVRLDSTLAYYSTYNSAVDITAPGGDVTIDQDGDGYVDGVLQQTHDGTNYSTFSYYFYQGTSMASPHVAGVAALIVSASNGTLTPDQVEAILKNSAVDLGPAGWDNKYGYGLLDANAALLAVVPNTNPPVASFTGTPVSGNTPLTVNFTDGSTNSPTSWSWTFGDGGTSSAQNPSHTYTTAGTYTVSLTATNAYGSDPFTRTNYITATTPACNAPVAAFSGTPTTGTAPLSVSFTDASTNSPTSWAWTFGDGGTSTAQNPNHSYTSAGTYSVSLTATNSCGSDPVTMTNYVTVTTGGGTTWTTITYDDFESGWGTYRDGGSDCARYTGGTYAAQGSAAIDIQDNSGTSSSFYHTSGKNVSGYQQLEVTFDFIAVSMENNEDFWVQYYNGSAWVTLATFRSGTDFVNNTFYTGTVTWNRTQVNFPTNAQLRFRCDASNNYDDVYIDVVDFHGTTTAAASAGVDPILFSATSTGNMINSLEGELLPEEFGLLQNYPNPFNPTTSISFNLETSQTINLEVFNISGQKVATLAHGVYSAGNHTVEFDASELSSGIYLYRLTSDESVETKKMVLLK